jgi:hypothetical protein
MIHTPMGHATSVLEPLDDAIDHGTPTLFIDGVMHRGGYDALTLLEALAR